MGGRTRTVIGPRVSRGLPLATTESLPMSWASCMRSPGARRPDVIPLALTSASGSKSSARAITGMVCWSATRRASTSSTSIGLSSSWRSRRGTPRGMIAGKAGRVSPTAQPRGVLDQFPGRAARDGVATNCRRLARTHGDERERRGAVFVRRNDRPGRYLCRQRVAPRQRLFDTSGGGRRCKGECSDGVSLLSPGVRSVRPRRLTTWRSRVTDLRLCDACMTSV
jgi:hypothetical protein